MSRWWRAEDTSIDHPKLLKLSDAIHRAWYTLNCIASANDGVLPSTADIAVRLRMKPAKVAEWITVLVRAELYDNDGGVFRPHNWNKRQYKTDVVDPTAAKRAKDYRDRKRDERNASRTVTRDATVRSERPEAETETYTEQSRADASAPIDEDLKRKVAALQAGISAHFLSRQQPIPNLDRCLLWLTQGYGSGTVLAAVETVLKRGRPISTLEYFDGAVRDAHAKAPSPPLAAVPEIDRSSWPIVVEGTPEHQCWLVYCKENRLKQPFLCKQLTKEGRLYDRAARCETLFPPGFNDFGERIVPPSEENAA